MSQFPTLSIPADDKRERPGVSIVVPVLNEEETLSLLLERLSEAMAGQADRQYEVILIDDGSTDASWATMQALAAADGRVSAVRLRRNFGKATALSIGAEKARAEILITIDADLQDDPKEIGNLLAKLDENWDMVCGFKKDRRDRLSKRVSSKLFNKVTRFVSGLGLHDFNCGLKAAKREIFLAIPLYGELHRYIPALAHNLGYRVTELAVVHHPRMAGRSKYGRVRYLRGLLDLLTVLMIGRYGRRPGHLFGGLGILIGSVGFAILLYLTGVWVFTDQGIGHRPLLLLGILLELLSAQLLALGLVAELIISRTSEPPNTRLIADETSPREVERNASRSSGP